MSQTEKAAYYQALKAEGVTFDLHYREYSTEDFKAAYEKLAEARGLPPVPEMQEPAPPALPPQYMPPPPPPPPAATAPRIPVAEQDPNERPGQRMNSQGDTPIRTDEQGRVWYQEEIQKPAYPKPRARRVLTYVDTGTKQVTVKNGEYLESFEVAGDEQARVAEVKITLPSYQVGFYRDPRLPFRVHVYGGQQGFDLFEVEEYYGGPELVPEEAKRIYVSNVLCYDIRTTVRAIEDEYRRLQLSGKI